MPTIFHQNFFTFFIAASILAVIPGPGIMFVLAQTAKGGRGAGFSSSIGTAIGGMFHVFAGALGVSAVVYSSTTLFGIVKFLGALYLFFLGLKSLKTKTAFSPSEFESIKFEGQSFRQGIVTEALNPKTALFFLALIPQFIPSGSHVTIYFVGLGCVSVLLNTLVDVIAVIFANRLLQKLRQLRSASHAFKYLSATSYFGLGLLALKASQKN